jgi:hypothetical protein
MQVPKQPEAARSATRLAIVRAVIRAGLIGGIVAALFLGVAGLAFAGIYGDQFPTREKYVKQAEKICKGTTSKMNKKTNAANSALKKGDTKAGGSLIIASSNIFGKGIRRLGKLVKPKDDVKVLKKWLKSLKGDAKGLANLGKIIKANGVGKPAQQALAKASAHATKTNSIVVDFGFRYCLVNA